MNKKRITILIGLISLAVLGLIAVQGYWFYDAYKLKQEQFKQIVISSIANISSHLQEKETIDNIKKEVSVFNDGSNHYQFDSTITLSPPIKDYSQPKKLAIKPNVTNSVTSIHFNSQVTINGEYDFFEDSVWFDQEIPSDLKANLDRVIIFRTS